MPGGCARLKELGFGDRDLARIHGPIGLPIGGISPAEVAISIVAQMVQILRRGERQRRRHEVWRGRRSAKRKARSSRTASGSERPRSKRPGTVACRYRTDRRRRACRAIIVARLEAGDVGEDEAARRVAAAAAGSGVSDGRAFTGRANLFAEARGLLVFDRERVDRLNLVDEAVTLGTLPPFTVVEPRQMVATVKIIPFAAAGSGRSSAAPRLRRTDGPLLRVAPFRPRSVGLIQTRLPGLKESILDKTRQVTEARLAALGCKLVFETRCAHAIGELAAA